MILSVLTGSSTLAESVAVSRESPAGVCFPLFAAGRPLVELALNVSSPLLVPSSVLALAIDELSGVMTAGASAALEVESGVSALRRMRRACSNTNCVMMACARTAVLVYNWP